MLKLQPEELKQAINQLKMWQRAGDYFSLLTLGPFKGLRDDLSEEGKPILHGLRPDDYEIGIEAMSGGTTDQLFLSLRLAALEQHLIKKFSPCLSQ